MLWGNMSCPSKPIVTRIGESRLGFSALNTWHCVQDGTCSIDSKMESDPTCVDHTDPRKFFEACIIGSDAWRYR
jgi:hypothetical protein